MGEKEKSNTSLGWVTAVGIMQIFVWINFARDSGTVLVVGNIPLHLPLPVDGDTVEFVNGNPTP